MAGIPHVGDVNDAGQVVGVAASRAFLWQNGTKTDLGGLGSGSVASASVVVIMDVVHGRAGVHRLCRVPGRSAFGARRSAVTLQRGGGSQERPID
jgi:probable HAF family extracellular repeat protein